MGQALCQNTKMNKIGLKIHSLGKLNCFLIPHSSKHFTYTFSFNSHLLLNSLRSPVHKSVAEVIIKPSSEELHNRYLPCTPGLAMCRVYHGNSC